MLKNISRRLNRNDHDVTIEECNTLLEKLGNSDEIRHWINNIIPKARLTVNEGSLRRLARQLRLEGDEESRSVLVDKMEKQGMDTSNSNSRSLVQTSADATHFLGLLVDENETTVAWDLLDKMIKNSAANEHQFNVMMKACNTSCQRQEMMEEMFHLNVQPSVVTYNTLVSQLMFEGKNEEARDVVEVEMPRVGVIPNEITMEILERDSEIWSRMQTAELDLLVQKDVASAWTFFDMLKENSAANEYHFTVMMKTCETSFQRREMMEEMFHLNVQPSVVTYNTLLNQLLFEGKNEEARDVVEVEMPKVGVIPNEITMEIVERDSEIWSRMRTAQLGFLLEQKDVASAWTFFDMLKENSAVGEHQFTLMMKACKTSFQIREMMEEMINLNVQPNVATYNMLLNQLKMEGKNEEAINVVEVEMPKVGVIPDEKTMKTLKKDSSEWGRMRTAKLRNLYEQKDVAAAWTLFNVLKENSAVDEHHFTVMMKACETSCQQQEMVQEMIGLNLRPDVVTYNMLVKQLRVEGKHEEARHVMEVEMPKVGVKPNVITRKLISRH